MPTQSYGFDLILVAVLLGAPLRGVGSFFNAVLEILECPKEPIQFFEGISQDNRIDVSPDQAH